MPRAKDKVKLSQEYSREGTGKTEGIKIEYSRTNLANYTTME